MHTHNQITSNNTTFNINWKREKVKDITVNNNLNKHQTKWALYNLKRTIEKDTWHINGHNMSKDQDEYTRQTA